MGIQAHLEEGGILREEVVVERSSDVQPSKKKLKIKLSSTTTSASPVHTPLAPTPSAPFSTFDVDMFADLASLPLPNFDTMLETGNYAVAMTNGGDLTSMNTVH